MILLVDIEATCGDSIPKEERETIEIGAVICEDDGQVIDTFQTLIQPVLHGTLTDFCIDLTGIKQSETDDAPIFGTAWRELQRWIHPNVSRWMSWGKFDKRQLFADCRCSKVHYCLPPHVDLSRVFKKNTGRRRGRRGALRYFGVESSGRNHRGLDDAKDVAQLLTIMTKQGWT